MRSKYEAKKNTRTRAVGDAWRVCAVRQFQLRLRWKIRCVLAHFRLIRREQQRKKKLDRAYDALSLSPRQKSHHIVDEIFVWDKNSTHIHHLTFRDSDKRFIQFFPCVALFALHLVCALFSDALVSLSIFHYSARSEQLRCTAVCCVQIVTKSNCFLARTHVHSDQCRRRDTLKWVDYGAVNAGAEGSSVQCDVPRNSRIN